MASYYRLVQTSFYQFTLSELQEKFGATIPSKLFNWFYKKRRTDLQVPDVSKATVEQFTFDLPKLDLVSESEDGTVKFLFELRDGKKIETVLIPSNKKYAVCLSSQVGCAMKCSFCYTGTQGLTRHLETHEIVGQLLAVEKWLERRIETIVFMGQGEPLHNFDSVRRACEIFLSQHGLCMAADKVTISTAGYLPGLQRWKTEMPAVNIALSLHAIDPLKRNELIPINQRFPLPEVLAAINAIPRKAKRFVIYEYLLAKGFNDSLEDARKLGETLRGQRAFVNMIPFNPFPGSKYERPDPESIQRFKAELDKFGVTSLVRFTKGDDVLAACGQLQTALH